MQERVSLMMIYTELGELNLENFGQNGDRHRLGLYYFHQAFDLMTITGDRNLLLDTTERLATATLKCGCAECQDEALQAYQKLLELLGDNLREGLIDEKSTKLERARLVGGIARCYQLKGHTGIALDYFRHTFSLLDGSLSAALEKKDFDAGLLYCYAAQCAVDAGNYEDAFTWYEKGFPLLRSGHQDFLSLRAVLANHP
jgi:tetratricopeptide (TPR) repeat protein